jgi:hypothetical protein
MDVSKKSMLLQIWIAGSVYLGPWHIDAISVHCSVNEALRKTFLGKTADRYTIQNVMNLTGSGTLRVLRPGDPATMDFRENRVTIQLDQKGNIREITCG